MGVSVDRPSFEIEAGRGVDLLGQRDAVGRAVPPADCQIAVVARSRSMAVTTHNIRDFEDLDINVVDPWMAT